MAWQAWKQAFLAEDGRVIDHRQLQASHSEGQGYALVLSVFHGDRATFDLVRGWTDANLRRRADGLLNWRLVPGEDRAEAPNATDGDIFFAWGLALGADRFGIPEARDQARKMAAAVSAACIRPDPRDLGRLVILPAAEGFMRGTKAIINPSYIMPRALHDLALLTRDARLAQAATDGSRLLAELAQDDLVPNWAELDGAGVRPSSEQPSRFGYDAMRVALYLIWSGQRDHAAVRRALRLYDAHGTGDTPVVVDLDGATVHETSTYPGFAALRGLVGGADRGHSALNVDQGYYPATLEMLCTIAAEETGPVMAAA